MPTFAESIKLEAEKPANAIRLVLSGTFLRAYNRSAWLFQCCITEYHVMKKYVKSTAQDVYFVGFPIEKLFDIVGGRKTEKTEFGFDVMLSDEEMPSPDAYDAWTQTVKTLPSSKADYYSLPMTGADAEKEVLRRLRDYPFERKTLIDNTLFLSELRQLLDNK